MSGFFLSGMRVVVLGLGAILAAGFAKGDGTYYPSLSDVERPPRMPVQRAILYYAEGQETLVIQSGLEADKGTYGWIVPIPAWPNQLAAASAFDLDRDFSRYGPRIQTVRHPPMLPLLLASAFLLIVGLTLPLRYRNWVDFPKPYPFVEVAVGTILLSYFVVFGPMMKGSATRAGATEGGLTDYDVGEVGSYDVKILRSKDGAEVLAWLAEHRFRVGDRDPAILREYAEKGWCFLAARIQKSRNGLESPHPLRVRFPVAQPIYPMRLTGAHTGALRLELLVLGPRQATSDALETWSCRIPFEGSYFRPPVSEKTTKEKERFPIGVATYLRADLTSKEIGRDLTLGWKKPEESSKRLYLARDFRAELAFRFALVLPLAAMGFGLIATWCGWDSRRSLNIGIILMMVVAAGIALATYLPAHILNQAG